MISGAEAVAGGGADEYVGVGGGNVLSKFRELARCATRVGIVFEVALGDGASIETMFNMVVGRGQHGMGRTLEVVSKTVALRGQCSR